MTNNPYSSEKQGPDSKQTLIAGQGWGLYAAAHPAKRENGMGVGSFVMIII